LRATTVTGSTGRPVAWPAGRRVLPRRPLQRPGSVPRSPRSPSAPWHRGWRRSRRRPQACRDKPDTSEDAPSRAACAAGLVYESLGSSLRPCRAKARAAVPGPPQPPRRESDMLKAIVRTAQLAWGSWVGPGNGEGTGDASGPTFPTDGSIEDWARLGSGLALNCSGFVGGCLSWVGR
jgi:hypothetical protein